MATAVSVSWIRTSCVRALWNLIQSENGDSFEWPEFGDKTVTVTGNFDTATITLKGSNDGTNWFTLEDFLGNPCTFTAAGMKTIGNSPRYIRPEAGAGAGAVSVAVNIVARGASR